MPHVTTTLRAHAAVKDSSDAIVGQGGIALPIVGEIWIAWSERGLRSLRWATGARPETSGVRIYRRLPSAYARPLRAYAKGNVIDLASEVPLDLVGTAFQRRVWGALCEIAHGSVRTYAGIAADIGKPRASRAVGTANGKNPVPIVVPCHRVVGCGHTLGGFSAGLDRKRALLQLEGVRLDGDRLLPGQLTLF